MPTPIKVLHIEDVQDDAFLVRRELERNNYAPDILRVETEQELERLLSDDNACTWDIILSDHMLRDFDSFDVLQMLKRCKREIPCIIVSGAIGEERAVAALKAGASDYVMKGNLSRLTPVVEREMREARIREEKQKYEQQVQAIFASSVDIILIADNDGRYLNANPAAYELFGITQDELLQKSVAELFFDGNREVFHPLWQTFLQEGSQQGELSLTLPDGSKRDFDYRATANFLPGWHLSVLRDITDRKWTEQALKESQERFSRVIDGSNEGYWDWSPSSGHLFWSARVYEMVGLPKDSQELSIDVFNNLLQEEDRERVHLLLQHSIDENVPFEAEFRMRHHQGHYVDMFSRGKPYLDENGKITRLAGMVSDISERKRAEEMLLSYARKLELSNRDLEQFATFASHDLQAPLRKIEMFSSYIEDLTVEILPPEAKDYMSRIRASTRKMQGLIQDLLDLSRITRKGKPFETVDLGHIVAEVAADLQFNIQEVNGTIETGQFYPLQADPAQMRQLLQNLVENALKFRKDDEPPVVHISMNPPDDQASTLVVEDNGIGFDSEHVARIFEPFERLTPGKTSGTGIGLAICKKIVERHGGAISAVSKPGQGSRFYVTLPLRPYA